MKNIIKVIGFVVFLSILLVSCEKEKIENETSVESIEEENGFVSYDEWLAGLSDSEKAMHQELLEMSERDPRGGADLDQAQGQIKGAAANTNLYNNGNNVLAVSLHQRRNFGGGNRLLWQNRSAVNQWWSHKLTMEVFSISIRANTHVQVLRNNKVIFNVNRRGLGDWRKRDLAPQSDRCDFRKGDVVRYNVGDSKKRLAGFAYKDAYFRGAFFPIWMGGNVLKGRLNGELQKFNDQISSFRSVRNTQAGAIIFSRNFQYKLHDDIAFPGAVSLVRMNRNDAASSYHVRWK